MDQSNTSGKSIEESKNDGVHMLCEVCFDKLIEKLHSTAEQQLSISERTGSINP